VGRHPAAKVKKSGLSAADVGNSAANCRRQNFRDGYYCFLLQGLVSRGIGVITPVAVHQDILSRYKSPVLLKQGGQKAAFFVRETQWGDAVVKIGAWTSEVGLERIRREVAVLKAIDSPFFPKQFSFELETRNRFVLVEQHIPSRPLQACLSEFTKPTDALEFIAHAVSALSILWAKRIVHRDVKPDNILVRQSRVPVLIDLGIARLLDADSLTQSIAHRGPCTPVYAAPEQLKNRKATIDARTDQFSLGIVLLQLLLSGQHPFDPAFVGTGDSIVENILNGRWSSAGADYAKNPKLCALVAKLMKPEPHMRYRDSVSLVADINEAREEANRV
jgi:serine/threonine protein kinase